VGVAELTEGEELFGHQVTAWTAGQLRKALEGVPDDMPVTVVTAEEPGSDIAGDEQVVISAAPWVSAEAWPRSGPVPDSADAMRAKLASSEVQPDHLEISLEFPSGQYYRRAR
jgi:hypothetical protein